VGSLFLAAAALLALMPAKEVKKPESTVEKLAWIAGHWSLESRGRTIEEHWTRPAGGTMIGMGRTTAGDKTVEFEFLQIRQEGEDLFYVAQPNGGTKTAFKLIKLTDGEAIFENKEHDFPQRIIYKKGADGVVQARIEGEVNGKLRGMDFPYKRAKCEAGDK
jgi:hypothetical protein